MWPASLTAIHLVYLCANVEPWGLLPAALPAPFSATLSLALSVYLCANVEPQGLLVVRLPAPFVPHSASLSPLHPRCPSQPLLPVRMNVYLFIILFFNRPNFLKYIY